MNNERKETWKIGLIFLIGVVCLSFVSAQIDYPVIRMNHTISTTAEDVSEFPVVVLGLGGNVSYNYTGTIPDTNATTACSGGAMLLGNGSCMLVTQIGGISDTNESTRFGNLVAGDCASGYLVIGVQTNGTVLCAADSGESGNIFDQDLNTTSDVIFHNLNVSQQFSANTTGIFLYRLTSCDTIDTLADGRMVCGSDDSGTGQNFNLTWQEYFNTNITDWAGRVNDTYLSTYNATYEINHLTSFFNSFALNLSWWQGLFNESYLSTFNASYFLTANYSNAFDTNISSWEGRVNDTYLSTYNATYDAYTDTNATTECGDGEHLDGSGNCLDTNRTIDLRTNSTTYFAWNITTVSGTLDAGNITSIQYPEDTATIDTYNVSEATGADPLIIYVNFSNVSSFDSVIGRIKYSGGQGHEIQVEIQRLDTGAWENYIEFTDTTDFVNFYVPVFDPENHVASGQDVSIRFNHDQNGIPSHDFFIDYLVIVEGWTALTTADHDALGGRDEITNHPQYLDTAATRNITGNLEFDNGQNLTMGLSGWFKGLFNWVVNTASSNWLSFNGTTITFNATQFNVSTDDRIDYHGLINNASYLSTYNSTYAGSINNASYLSTFNATYEAYAGADYYVNETGDTMTGNLTFVRGAGLVDADTGTYEMMDGGKIITVFRRT